ncbi:MAG: DUF368 domain-containing protein [Myxococcales bacterium]|nr:DUF368 domain-containing protein [Myxococcales bacterium]
MSASATSTDDSNSVPPQLIVRGGIGGVLMGLANLVPGISGGTMLLAAGVYPGFIGAIAEITTLRFRLQSVVTLASVGIAAALSILLLAGSVKLLVEEHRWLMYSLFIGLTLGGVPLVWKMARPASPGLIGAAVGAFALMVVMAIGGDASGGGEATYLLTFLAGLAASSAMILPGVSGGYLLLLLGQYEPILGTIDQLKTGILGEGGPDFALVLDAMHVVIPLGVGIVVGVVGVSNLLQWLLERYAKPTLGALLGLLLGAVVGLWPFQEAREPVPGDVIKGHVVTAANAADFDSENWPVSRFTPAGADVAMSLGLIGSGLAATLLIGRLGRDPEADDETLTAQTG